MSNNSLTLREKIGLRNGDIKLTPQIMKKMDVENIWKHIEEYFFDWRTELKTDISVAVYYDEVEGIKIELRSNNESLTTTCFSMAQLNPNEIEDFMRGILSQAIYEGMNVKLDARNDRTNQIVIWYQP